MSENSSQVLKGRVGALMKENQLLGRLLQELQAKLECSESEVSSLDTELNKRESDLLRMEGQLAQCRQEATEANNKVDSYREQLADLEQQLSDVSGRLADREAACEALQRRLGQAEGELRRLRNSSVSGQDVSQQLQRVEALYRARVEALQREAAEQLAAQDAAARQRLAEAQAATAAALARVKRGALHEVQRAEAFLESRLRDQNRVLEQLHKRCQALEARAADLRPLAVAAAEARQRAAELEGLLAAAEEEVAAVSGGGGGIVDLRAEALRDCEVVVQLQADLAAAQQGRVAAAERAEAADAAYQSLRAENAELRKQLLLTSNHTSSSFGDAGEEAGGGGCEHRELALAKATALAAVESEAACTEALRSAQREAAAAQRALLAQVRRMHTLEAMRLADVQNPCALSRCMMGSTRSGGAGVLHNAPHRGGSSRPRLPAASASGLFPHDGDYEGARDPLRRVLDRLRDVKPASDAGRPANRGSPLSDYSALLSSYTASKLEELLKKTEVNLGELQADMRVKLRHPVAAGMALLCPELAVAEYNACPLPASHLACLGEAVVHLASVELAWTVMEKSTAEAEAQTAAEASSSFSASLPPHVGIDKTLMTTAAQEVTASLPQLLVERWKLDKHARYGTIGSNQRPAKKDLANVAKALLAVLYLDGGYAEAVRPALAPLLAEVLLRPRAGSDSEDSKAAVSGQPTQSSMDVVGRLLEQALVSQPPSQRRQPPQLHLPRGKDDLQKLSGCASSDLQMQMSREAELLTEYLAPTLGPLLLALETFEEAYTPRHVERFVELSALWYSYLYGMPPPPARGQPVPCSWEGLARGRYLDRQSYTPPLPASSALHPPLPHATATSAAAPAALLVLGRAVYCVAVMELLLEREAANPVEDKTALGYSKNVRGVASDRIRKQAVQLCGEQVRTLQMQALVPALARDNGDAAMRSRVPAAVHGVLGAVMLEGGLKHARALARRLLEVAEVPEARARLERVHAEATARYRPDA
ncbi:hypothetical protein HYH02_002824 [Chlamydomonas schloesseri]|uniref:Uncharacterized protein n=1 Tax=Chlamydomonas schloesseri TaxID=2026947 RepID=A0A836BAE8_9CHLO|nr:hypothetical protein HYH02_002824 [Chlamydomonas schloesseri]|eukprot:KAG2452587.1 hypothetical protein HYH02_002824 [Chlamydomonas schloesseri]